MMSRPDKSAKRQIANQREGGGGGGGGGCGGTAAAAVSYSLEKY